MNERRYTLLLLALLDSYVFWISTRSEVGHILSDTLSGLISWVDDDV